MIDEPYFLFSIYADCNSGEPLRKMTYLSECGLDDEVAVFVYEAVFFRLRI